MDEHAYLHDPARSGAWQAIQHRFKHLPIHMALLHTGKVLAFGGSGNDPDRLADPYPAEIFDPQTGEVHSLNQPLGGDLFCAGHTFLADGRLLVAGGTFKYNKKLFGTDVRPFCGLEQAYLFDPHSETWTRAADMALGRWYPSLIQLSDGRALVMAGLMKGFPWVFLRSIEIYTPGQGWRKSKKVGRWLPLYPRLHLLPDGQVFYSGSFNTHYTYPFNLRGFPTALLDVQNETWHTIGPPNTSQRQEGASLLLPLLPPDYRPRVLLVGGGLKKRVKIPVPDVEIIDLSVENPAWRRLPPMEYARYHCYAVLLPDQQVFVLGGRREEEHHAVPLPVAGTSTNPSSSVDVPDLPHDVHAILETEMFDPGTETWRPMAAMQVDRLYHSNILLLPDGRVLVAGSNPAQKVNELRIEIYHPSYLFQGPRPKIEAAPAQVAYGEEFPIKTPDAREIDAVALIRPTSTTHCFSTEQRHIGLTITGRNQEVVTVLLPRNPHLAPPGYYMLFQLSAGIPSEARFIQVG
ncbi:MAG TPA: galactose oxidase-like domain-containing protein [Anaerolineales bacterium]|nr:galactose oxidase-like domain-containing protein [Anaerolineales bacterium]